MTSETARPKSAAPSLAIARTFVAARRAARALPGFPGETPRTLEAGYATQEAAIGVWGGEIIGWKVGKIPDELVDVLGQTRVTGPIFREGFWPAEPSGRNPVPVFVGGFAALEAEFVFELTTKGLAGVPRASFVVIAAALPLFHLPQAGLLLILGVDHLLDMGRAATNVVGNPVASVVVSRWEGLLGEGAPAAPP